MEAFHKFEAVIAPNMTGCSVTINQLFQPLQHSARFNVASRMSFIRFLSILVLQTQSPKAASFYGGVVDGVPRPNMTPVFVLRWVKPCADPTASLLLLTEALLAQASAVKLA